MVHNFTALLNKLNSHFNGNDPDEDIIFISMTNVVPLSHSTIDYKNIKTEVVLVTVTAERDIQPRQTYQQYLMDSGEQIIYFIS